MQFGQQTSFAKGFLKLTFKLCKDLLNLFSSENKIK